MTAQSTYRHRDLETAVKVIRKAGIEIAKVEIGTDGKITITTGRPGEEKPQPINAFDGARF